MTLAIETDLGPLAWVKGEIDAALGRAREALEQAGSASDPLARVQFAQTHLNQVRGALSIIGLDGLTQFAEGANLLLGDMARGAVVIDSGSIDVAKRALAAIGNYVEELSQGVPDQPLRLSTLFDTIAITRGQPSAGPVELFHPDLSQRPPRRTEQPALSADDTQSRLRGARTRFERGLLDWLRNAAGGTGAQAMRDAIAEVEALQPSPTARALWWASLGFFDALIAGTITPDPTVKKLCAQIDAQFRRLLGGTTATPERLLREVLYRIALAPATTDQQRDIRACWRLDALIPPAGAGVSEIPLTPLLQQLRARLVALREQWDAFCGGTAFALALFEDLVGALAADVSQLGRPALIRLIGMLADFTRWLRHDPLNFSDAIALEVAGLLLQIESALDPRVADASLAAQIDATNARLAALQRGEAITPPAATPEFDGMRRAQEREALGQLTKEMLSSLAQVEQTLDDYFRNPQKRAALGDLQRPLQQILGALSMLGETEAIALMREAGTSIARFAAPDAQPDQAGFEALAHKLSALGFYIESLQHGRADLQALLEPGSVLRDETGREEAPVPEAAASVPMDATPLPTVEPEALAPQPPVAPVEAATGLAQETGVETPPAETAPPAPATPAAGVEIAFEPEPALTTPPVAAAPQATPATQPPAVPGEAEIDAELLEIFIEEAHEVLATIGEHLELSRTEPANGEHLVVIRRGFHTLKGSGRMVGLRDVGEAAWGIEQTLNRWLQLEWPPTPALHHLVDAARQLFIDWVARLEAGSTEGCDAGAILAEAERLRNAEAPPTEPATFTTAATAEVEALPLPSGEETDFTELNQAETGEILPLVAAEEEGPAADAWPAPPLEFEFEPSPSEPEAALSALEGIEEVELPEEPQPPLPLEEIAPAPEEWTEPPAEPEAWPVEPTVAETAPMPAAEPPPPESVIIGDAELSQALYDLYRSEAATHLATLHEECARLAANPSLLPPENALRAAHTLAGISGTARLSPLHTLGRALEHAIARLRDSARPATSVERARLAECTATLQSMLAEVTLLRMPNAAPALEQALDEVGRALPAAPEPSLEADETPAESPAEARWLETADLEAESLEAEALETEEAPAPAESVAQQEDNTARPATTPPAPEAAPAALQDDIDQQLLPLFIEEAADLLGELHATLRAWEEAPSDTDHAKACARLLHSFKGSARMAGAMTLGEYLHQLESQLEEGASGGEPPIDDLAAGLDRAELMMDALAAGEPLPASGAPAGATQAAPALVVAASEGPAEAETATAATLRVRADLVDRFVNQAGEIGIARTRIEGELRTLRGSLLELTDNVIRLRNQLREVEIQADMQMQSRIAQAESHHAEFDPLEMDRYTRLQELTRMLAESVNDVTTVQQNLLHNLDGADLALHAQARMSRDLQQALMRVRMLPFESLADRLYRVVRQSAKELGKRAHLDLRGGRIEIDRSVLEQMAAPLEHLLRNALAHGIETPERRRAAGKSEIGQITLTARQEGNEIAIELADDGAGLDFARIEARARSNGLIETHEQVDVRRLTNLIFLPGFSTAQALSTVSGRGVGMDVVKSQTAAVGGRVDVSSQQGRGTTFTIHLPLTLAVTQALLVRAAGRTYAIPSSMVAQVMELKTDALRQIQADRGTEWMGEQYAYRYLPRLLGDNRAQPEEQRYNWLLLLRAGAQTLALHVDALRGNQEIVVKNAGPQLTRIVGMSGATVLGDGEVVLILNPVALASRGLGLGEEIGHAAMATATPTHVPTVMVVDDSLTVRKITGRLLEREGYRVITAKDGVDALEKLIETVPDVVLSDIEMPRMDGFDLVRNIRADERTRALPVIMITSRLADKHRRYATEVGANHYLGKPYAEEELLALLAGYTGRHYTPQPATT